MRKTSGHWMGPYLKKRGVDTLFGVTGYHVWPILDGCVEADIRVVDTRHEQGAAFAAEGWALRTGKPGVYTATAGPGFVNVIAGLAHASVTLSPIFGSLISICDINIKESFFSSTKITENSSLSTYRRQ